MRIAMLRLSSFTMLALMFAAMPEWPAAAAEPVLDIAVPRGVKLDTLFQPDQKKSTPLPSHLAFDIDPDGLPAIAEGTALKVLGSSQELLSLGVLAIDDFAFMRDDRLLLVIQGQLASLSPRGIVLGLLLPNRSMRIRPAGEHTAYVFGGSRDPENRDVYLFARDGTVTKLATLPSSVTAVAGDGITSYVATDRTILRIAWQQPTRMLLQTRDPIISLEIAPRQGLFYATKSSVGYVDSNGGAYEFIRGAGGAVRVRNSSLYVLMSEGHLLRLGPIGAFEQGLK